MFTHLTPVFPSIFNSLLECEMFEENLAKLRTHHKNIQRYRQLLETGLTDFEREYWQAPCGRTVGYRDALYNGTIGGIIPRSTSGVAAPLKAGRPERQKEAVPHRTFKAWIALTRRYTIEPLRSAKKPSRNARITSGECSIAIAGVFCSSVRAIESRSASNRATSKSFFSPNRVSMLPSTIHC